MMFIWEKGLELGEPADGAGLSDEGDLGSESMMGGVVGA